MMESLGMNSMAYLNYSLNADANPKHRPLTKKKNKDVLKCWFLATECPKNMSNGNS
jgi:hypothetical protein